ncbi:MAG: DUF4091 domain-containing protein [Planctomycetes bacterium]|nr:DUF4091 domain-containing protein [Planctomycetota bacterium]
MSGWRFVAVHEWIAHDPFGRPKDGDLGAGVAPESVFSDRVRLRAARGAYASLRVLVQGSGGYRLSAAVAGIEVDLAKAWYHRFPGDTPHWLPDALVPVASGASFALPDADNAVPGQTTQEFWVDLYVPRDAAPGERAGAITLDAGGAALAIQVAIDVLAVELPAEPTIVMDKNAYGCRWLERQYPAAYKGLSGDQRWLRLTGDLHNVHRIFHEHRGCFHHLGHGHSGAFDPIYGPRAVGAGRDRRLEGWEKFDALYGPLLDGSCFASAGPGQPRARRGATPVWGIYSPLNPDWPARYVNWGEEGYRVEFRRCIAEFDQHLRDKGWTRTHIEFFLNHKKRYRWFGWDGDETKYAKDDAYHLEIARLFHAAIKGSPVRWSYRMDASWRQGEQFETLADSVDFWVCNDWLTWYRDAAMRAVERGNTVFTYGGTPSIAGPTSDALQSVYLAWARKLSGYLPWLSISPGDDPWFASDGGGTASIYPGERFGIDGPIASIRLKIERNGVQDIDLMSLRAGGGADALRADLAKKIAIKVWKEPSKVARVMDPADWDSFNLEVGHEPGSNALDRTDPAWFSAIRSYANGGSTT